MEEARYWMWAKRNNILSSDQVVSPHTKPLTYGDSLEEQAFLEDAAGALVWPPRSYTCSFCGKEFKSAQALGGHMNVHRRDRARLKQPTSPNNSLSSPTTSLGIHQFSSPIRTLLYNQDSEHDQFLASPISLPSRVCTIPVIQSNCDEKALLSSPLLSPPSLQENEKRVSLLWPNRFADRYCDSLGLEKDEKSLDFVESKCKQPYKRDYVSADLCVSLGIVVRGPDNYSGEDDDSSIMSFKRRRTDDATVSLFPKQTSSIDRNVVHPQLEIKEVCSSPKEDLDLELRLGVDSQRLCKIKNSCT